MKNKRTAFSLVLGLSALLLVCAAIQLRPSPSPRQRDFLLRKALPASLPGGAARDEPIAATVEMKKAVNELLSYDDGVFRIYDQPWGRVSVYAAWWQPGKMSPRLVATHTPDVCWPGNGWERDAAAEVNLTTLAAQIGASGFAAGECRVFKMRGTPEYVVFWHKVGDEMHSYGTGHAPPWWAIFDDIRRDGLNLRKEQLFVRVSSDQPLESVWEKADTLPLRKALLDLGLGSRK